MARPFAYNSGSAIAGTVKYGNLTVATSSQNFSGGYGGVKWWNGPDESIGWVLGFAREDNQQPGFIRTNSKTDAEFLSMVNNLSERKNQTPFTDGAAAKTWLNANGYWTNWVASTPPGPAFTLLADLDAADNSSYPGVGTDWFDLTSNNNDGTLEAGSGSLTYTTTVGGEFDTDGGNGTRISFADNADLSLSTSTYKAYSIWFNADRVGFVNFSDTLISKQSGNPQGDGFIMAINSTNQLIARVTSDGGSTNKSIAGIGATISTGTWYMGTLVVKISSDVDTMKLYINTTEVGSTNGGGSAVNDSDDLYLGNIHSGLQNLRSFDGKIAEFYVHEGDFTAADVATLFDATKTRFGY